MKTAKAAKAAQGVLEKWQKTPYELAILWSKLEMCSARLNNAIRTQYLSDVTAEVPELRKLMQTIARAQVANKVLGAK
jgi:hypothetical protein